MRREVVNRPPSNLPRKRSMKDGLFPVVGTAGAVSAALVWAMTAHDPYWRLFETPSMPAPAYEAPNDLEAALETATLSFGNADTGATSQDAVLSDPTTGSHTPLMAEASPPTEPGWHEPGFAMAAGSHAGVAIPAPMLALTQPYEPAQVAGPAADRMAAYELPRFTALPSIDHVGEPGATVAAVPVPLPAPVAVRDRGAAEVVELATADGLNPFVAPDAPAQPRTAADEGSEEALALNRSKRVDIQRRLALAGFDPKGLDGVFGPRTREAIADFQTAWGFPATGYLEPSVYADLNDRTAEAYEALRRQAAASPKAAPELAPAARERQLASAEDEGRCARRSDGRIIARQSIACDLAGMAEQFVSFGRNSLDDGQDSEVASAATESSSTTIPDADR
jgi:hypothetical protein